VLSEEIDVQIKGFYTRITDASFVGARHAVPLQLPWEVRATVRAWSGDQAHRKLADQAHLRVYI